ncbi:MAG: response regulator [Acidobacteria bacterium]|nr:response regulator [Acidobacteriota bacterium]
MNARKRFHTTPTHDGTSLDAAADRGGRRTAATTVKTLTASSTRRRAPRLTAPKSVETKAPGIKPAAQKVVLEEVPQKPKQRRTPRVAPASTPVITPPSAITLTDVPHPELFVATADSSLEQMLRFALEQVHLPHQVFNSGTRILQMLLAIPAGGRAPIVVLDVDLPGVDGYSILERLWADRPDTFLIIVLSSHADESVQVRSILAGAVDHLAKPFNIRVLLAKLQRWVAISGNRLGDRC